MPNATITANGITITDNSNDVKNAYEQARERSLEMIGLTAEEYAKKTVPTQHGRLKNSITHAVDGKNVIIGTNVEYAPYVEFGTGVYAEGGGGRSTPWVYKDETGFHWTQGMMAKPFLRPAATEHPNTYKQIVLDEFAKIK